MAKVIGEALIEILGVPVWWYTGGTLAAFERCGRRLRDGNDYLGLSVWVKNLFVPMYGQYDIAGRFISIGIRLAQILVRGVLFTAWTAIAMLLLFGYLFLPIVVVYKLWRV